MAKYAYPAVFTPEENGLYSVNFPDVPSCYTDGEGIADALEMANDVLCLRLYDIEESGEAIPAPSPIKAIKTDESKGEFVTLVACDTVEYRKFYDNKAVKKTLTIPNWLNTIAERSNVNFSQVLQEALTEKLGLDQ